MPVPLLPSMPLSFLLGFEDSAAAMSGDVGLLSLLLVLLLLDVPGRPNRRSSIKSGCPLPLLAAARTPRLLLLLLILAKLPRIPPAALGATRPLGLGDSSGACRKLLVLPPLLLLPTAAVRQLIATGLTKHAAGCKCVRHGALILLLLLLLLPTRRIPLGFPCTAQHQYQAS
jgi:hypothetical protein